MNKVNGTAHTTLLLVLTDGTHRTTQWYMPVTFPVIVGMIKDHARWIALGGSGATIAYAVLAGGAQLMTYSAADVAELVQNLDRSSI